MGGEVGPNPDDTKRIVFRKVATDSEVPTPPFTGIVDLNLPGSYNLLPQVAFISKDPLPFTLLGMTLAFDVGGMS